MPGKTNSSVPGEASKTEPKKAIDTKSAARTMELFALFARFQKSLSLTEISENLGAPASSCFQLIRTLQKLGYIYTLGARRGFYPTQLLLRLAERAGGHDPLRVTLAPHLKILQERTGETIVAGILQENEVMIIDVVESRHRIRYVPEVGDRRPLHATSLGRSLLSIMSSQTRADLLGSTLTRHTDATVVDPNTLEDILREGQERGYFYSKGESLEGMTSVGVPVTIDETTIAIAIAGPSVRCDARIDEFGTELLATVENLTGEAKGTVGGTERTTVADQDASILAR